MPSGYAKRMFSLKHTLAVSVTLAAALAFALGGAAALAQTTQASPTPNANCAVSTARIGTLDVTQFFGVRIDTPSAACMRLEVANPTPGDMLPVGGYAMSGFVFDPTASTTDGTGITGVQVFLDDPNQGGAVIGTAKALNQPSQRAASFGDQFANSGFGLTVQIPGSATGSPHALFIQALSTTGRVGTVAVPVLVGNLTPPAPTRTP